MAGIVMKAFFLFMCDVQFIRQTLNLVLMECAYVHEQKQRTYIFAQCVVLKSRDLSITNSPAIGTCMLWCSRSFI